MSIATADTLQAAPTAAAQLRLEECGCPLCGGDQPRPTAYGRDPFRVVRCGGCRHWYLSPRLHADEMDAFYREGAYFRGEDAGYRDYEAQEQGLRATFRRLIRRLDRMGAAGGDLLEVGTGLGYFLDEARTHFAGRSGVELSDDAARAAAALSGATLYGALDDLPAEASFDCVAALHVIEHVYDPVAFAAGLAARLRPGGVLVLAAPDMGSFWRLAMGSRWPSFKYPEHVSFFDATTLPRVLAGAGLTGIRRLPYVHDFPLREICAKLGFGVPAPVAGLTVPLPSTTVCFAAQRSSAWGG